VVGPPVAIPKAETSSKGETEGFGLVLGHLAPTLLWRDAVMAGVRSPLLSFRNVLIVLQIAGGV
jgi:threonine/homoserine/homoserine lactone efflux protein